MDQATGSPNRLHGGRTMDPLRTSLLDLLYELRDERTIPLTVGGGFELFLNPTTLLRTAGADPVRRAPGAARHQRHRRLLPGGPAHGQGFDGSGSSVAIRRLGYVPVEEARYFQWKRPVVVGGVTQEVKLDALVGPLGNRRGKLHVNSPRVRPKGKSVGFHATPERRGTLPLVLTPRWRSNSVANAPPGKTS